MNGFYRCKCFPVKQASVIFWSQWNINFGYSKVASSYYVQKYCWFYNKEYQLCARKKSERKRNTAFKNDENILIPYKVREDANNFEIFLSDKSTKKMILCKMSGHYCSSLKV